jgi:hypothetical protein
VPIYYWCASFNNPIVTTFPRNINVYHLATLLLSPFSLVT